MICDKLLKESKKLCREAGMLHFSRPVTHVYSPLEYAWEPYSAYIKKYATAKKRVIFLGMNPGPWGMAQVGVPFGEISYVRDWLGIEGKVGKPRPEHPSRPVEGFHCKKSEVSGARLWGLLKKRFVMPEKFFKEHLVLNYCPLAFMDKNGRNITPDKLKKTESKILFELCDASLEKTAAILEPEWVIGIGNFVEIRLRKIFGGNRVKIGKILHPSPASPAANAGWAAAAAKQLRALDVWE